MRIVLALLAICFAALHLPTEAKASSVEPGFPRRFAPRALFIGNPDNDLAHRECRDRLQGAFLDVLMGAPWCLRKNSGWSAITVELGPEDRGLLLAAS